MKHTFRKTWSAVLCEWNPDWLLANSSLIWPGVFSPRSRDATLSAKNNDNKTRKKKYGSELGERGPVKGQRYLLVNNIVNWCLLVLCQRQVLEQTPLIDVYLFVLLWEIFCSFHLVANSTE